MNEDAIYDAVSQYCEAPAHEASIALEQYSSDSKLAPSQMDIDEASDDVEAIANAYAKHLKVEWKVPTRLLNDDWLRAMAVEAIRHNREVERDNGGWNC